MMRKFLIPTLFFVQLQASFLDWFSSTSPQAKEAETLLTGFDQVVEQAMKDYEVPGLAIGVVVDGHVVYLKGFGVRDLETKLPVTEDTVFRVGSCTKAFTSFAMGTLVDEGLMNWDQKVIDVLPDFRLYDQYATQNLTFRDLLTHRSGVPRHDFMWYNSSMTRTEVMSRLRYLEPSCDIRERYQYNNLMYLTTGYAMQQVTGKSWDQLISERILDPLGMKQTNFNAEAIQTLPNFALPYIEREGKLRKMSFRNIMPIGPAGAMNSSVSDMTKWITMLLNKGKYNDRILISPSVLQEMQLPQTVITGTPDTKEMVLCSYGIGWHVCSYRGQYLVHHDGGVDGYVSQVSLLPHSNLGLIILANKNLTPLPLVLSLQILDKVMELPPIDWVAEGKDRMQKMRQGLEIEKQNQENQRRLNTAPSHKLDDYAGDYVHPGYGKITVKHENEKLSATFNGITSFLNHWHYDVFYVHQESEDLILNREGMKFTFRTNVQGDIEELVIPFEASSSDIIFRKTVRDLLSDKTYLFGFTGFYEISGYTVEIALRGGQLYAMVPGMPAYELIPVCENEFSVRGSPGYAVRFLMNPAGGVDEVLIVRPPYGAFIAKPKR